MIVEGRTSLVVPEPPNVIGPGTSRMPVFFNPAMSISRHISVLFFSTLKGESLKGLDLLAGTGATSVRLLRETSVNWNMTINDKNPLARRYVETNLRLNGVCARVIGMRALSVLANGIFDFIDIDPHGSPHPYLHASAMACSRSSYLGVTATDTAALCGTYPRVSRRRYGAVTRRVPFTHELGLRVLIGYLVRVLASHDMAATPLISFAKDHFYRVILQIRSGATRADEALSHLGYAIIDQDGTHRTIDRPSTDSIGPLWAGPLASTCRLRNMHKSLSKAGWREDVMGAVCDLLRLLVEEESAPPLHYTTEEIAKRMRSNPVQREGLITTLRDSGFTATRTHFSQTGVRTDATFREIADLCRDLT